MCEALRAGTEARESELAVFWLLDVAQKMREAGEAMTISSPWGRAWKGWAAELEDQASLLGAQESARPDLRLVELSPTG